MKVMIIRIGRAGATETEIELPEGTTVNEAIKAASIEIHGCWIFVDGILATPERILLSDAELAITEPLMGG